MNTMSAFDCVVQSHPSQIADMRLVHREQLAALEQSAKWQQQQQAAGSNQLQVLQVVLAKSVCVHVCMFVCMI